MTDQALSLPLFALVAFGPGWVIASRVSSTAAERILASVALSLIGVFAFAWAVFVWSLPAPWLWAIPCGAVLALVVDAPALRQVARDREARELVLAQTLVSFWCLGWLSLVGSYSGGGWSGDWVEHWERARFFLERWPHDSQFIHQYALPARPPLANVVTAALLRLTRADFAHYQVFSTLLASCAFLPAALLARRWGDRRSPWILAALLMLNPMFIQNATFPWTKLPTAFFALGAVCFFLRARDEPATPGPTLLFVLCLAAGVLTHYSAGPYAVVLAVAWIGRGRNQWREGRWWRHTLLAGLGGAVLLSLWFAWAIAIYGKHGTFSTNSTVRDAGDSLGTQLQTVAGNLRDTLVPHFLRHVDGGLIAQQSTLGWIRDWFFQAYQLNLLLAGGSVAGITILFRLWSERQNHPHAARPWALATAGVILLGIAAHSPRDVWGLVHICLQAVVLGGLAFLAAQWTSIGRWGRGLLIGGATFDFLFGILLHFEIQSLEFDPSFTHGPVPREMIAGYSWAARLNFNGKIGNHLVFLSDAINVAPALILGCLGLLLILVILRGRRLDPTRGTDADRTATVSSV